MILIDADILTYRVGFACEGETVSVAVSTMDSYLADILVSSLILEFADDYQLYLTGSGNYRNEVAVTAPYKENRSGKAKPVHLDALREYLVENWGATVTDGEEADDAIAIAATQLGEAAVMVSIDKDFDQIPGWHYNFVKHQLYKVSPEEATAAFYQQVLKGDRIDNIIGLKGIGDVKAIKMLKDCTTETEYYNACVAAYVKHEKLSTEEAEARVLENARLLWLRRKEEELWLPPVRNEAEENRQ